ncbi:DUF3265 domain-containing protein [Vibrio vulnificus]|nr:DUF3265 domain-containing protein [Vibrio vulnificus]EIJ0985192.1 DUF3265 domain-containing protein [Vibrio vulnificus]
MVFRQSKAFYPDVNATNKRFKRDSQRVAFLPCVGFCDYDVMRKVRKALAAP